jgi:hypothetical protein
VSDPLTQHGLARFSEVANANVGDDKVPGMVALVARHDQVHVEVLGSLSIGGLVGAARLSLPAGVDDQAGDRGGDADACPRGS